MDVYTAEAAILSVLRRLHGRALKAADLLLGLALATLLLAVLWEGVREAVVDWTGLRMLSAEVVSLLLVVGITGAAVRFGLHVARSLGIGRFTAEERRILRRLRGALERREIEAFFQPILDTQSGTLAGAEALARWQIDGKPISPAVFIPLAERAGLIRDVTRQIARAAITAAGQWTSLGFDLPVSINLSAEDLDDQDLLAWLHGLCLELGVPESRIRIELTETQSIRNFDTTAAAVARLRDWGAGVHLDDFGTGYASMSVLQRIPFSGIKIDRDFVARAREDRTAASIVRASLGIARDLGLDLVAEGIEDADTAAWLHGIGVRQQQGFYFARPMPAREFAAFVLKGATEPSVGGAGRVRWTLV